MKLQVMNRWVKQWAERSQWFSKPPFAITTSGSERQRLGCNRILHSQQNHINEWEDE